MVELRYNKNPIRETLMTFGKTRIIKEVPGLTFEGAHDRVYAHKVAQVILDNLTLKELAGKKISVVQMHALAAPKKGAPFGLERLSVWPKSESLASDFESRKLRRRFGMQQKTIRKDGKYVLLMPKLKASEQANLPASVYDELKLNLIKAGLHGTDLRGNVLKLQTGHMVLTDVLGDREGKVDASVDFYLHFPPEIAAKLSKIREEFSKVKINHIFVEKQQIKV